MLEEEFLAENNACGQTLLHLVSRGNAIIAELLRLKEHIPSIFRLESKQDVQKYGELLMDFSYFSSSDMFDKKIEKTESLYKLDEELRETYCELLERFYLAYEGIYKYVTDLNTFIDELEEGVYLQQNFDTVFSSPDGIQLMCESVYLYGVQLLLLDLYHPGVVRERLVVAHSRYSISASCIDRVCRLIRSTGVTPSKRPSAYPTDYFRRIQMKTRLLDNVIGKLRTEDIYHQQKSLPLPEHSTTALASQAALLFVTLFFSPNILINQTPRMREIVDKFFPDNWIVNVYMGITLNVVDMWEGFKAAKAAINNIVEATNVREIAQHHSAKLEELLPRQEEMLKEGFLTKNSVLEQTQKILCLIRESNVTLRWLLLHTSQHSHLPWNDMVKKVKTIRDQVISDSCFKESKLLLLLLNTARFENIIIDLYKLILQERSVKWEESLKEAVIRLEELTDVFAGTKPLMRVNKSESLRKWFSETKENVESLNLEEPNVSARKIVQLVQALEEVQGYPVMESNLQVKQLLVEAATSLRLMLAAASVRDSVLVQVQIVTDFSYGWLLVTEYTALIQQWVTSDPNLLNKIRSLLHKLSSAMESCLIRMNQAGEEGDLSSVSLYYSGFLVSYAKDLLQVIPSTVFRLMSRIADIQTTVIPDLPARLDKDKLKQYAHLEARFQVAKESSEVCVFSSGLATMESTLLGVVRIEPKLLLEEGIRKELSEHIQTALSQGLIFNGKPLKGSGLSDKLSDLAVVIDGHQRSFEYIQDYIDIQGSKMWQEELRHVVDESVEEECLRIRRADVIGGKISLSPPSSSTGFMGVLAHHIINITDPRNTLYLESEWAWYDLKSRTKVLDSKLWTVLARAIGTVGLLGLSRIFAFQIVKHLQCLVDFLMKESQNNKAWNETFSTISQSLKPVSKTVSGGFKAYGALSSRVHKLTGPFSNIVTTVGSLQLLRKHMSYTLQLLATTQAPLYSSAVHTLNRSLVEEVLRTGELKECTEKLLPVLQAVGLADPYQQLYVTSSPVPYLALLIFLFTITYLPKFTYEKSLDCLMCKWSGESVYPLALGISTLLHQYHPRERAQYVAYCSQYFKSHRLFSLQNCRESDEGTLMLLYLEEFVEYSGLGRKEITKHIPDLVLDLFGQGISQYVQDK